MIPMQKNLNLALQGGGSHGAFTWGVLDRLLEEPDVVIEGMSGTSAGAVNAAVLASGYEKGGIGEARAALAAFWQGVGRYGIFSPYWSGWWKPFGLHWSPMAAWADWLFTWLSPYQLNPFDYNPLRELLLEVIDFERLRCCRRVKLFISATNVCTNRLRIFTAEQITPEVLLASTCLPQLYRAVKVDGDYYWDGGYMGNPVIEPLVRRCNAEDIMIVQINPKYRRHLPITAWEINNRLNEITFNATLMREIRGIANLTRMLDDMKVSGHDFEKAYFHLIDAEDVLTGLSATSKMDSDWGFIERLFRLGRERADAWLRENWGRVGRRGTLNLDEWAPPEA